SAPELTSQSDTLTRKKFVENFVVTVLAFVLAFAMIGGLIFVGNKDYEEKKNYVPKITIPSIDFTVLNLTETRLSVKWDLLIRIPPDLPGHFTCLKGDFQVLILYKGVTIANSSMESLIPHWPQQLNVSAIASEGDMDGAVVKDIMEDIKKGGEIRFGSRVILPDCRYGTSGKMNYVCDEATLRFEPGSQTPRKATEFGNQPTCVYVR
ncbi:unnamed protein product, partial [Thlaspi arvense]